MAINRSLLFQECRRGVLERLTEKHFGQNMLADAVLLTGGMFNTTYLVSLKNERKYVLRLGPVNRHLLMPFERDAMAAEAYVYKLCEEAGIPVPRVIAVSRDRELVDRDYMITEYIPSVPLSGYTGDKAAVRQALGREIRKMHIITGNSFGRVSRMLCGEGYESWGAAMMGELTDWESVAIPAGYCDAALANRLEKVWMRYMPILDQIEVPQLTHTDLWEGNILVSEDGSLAAVIDADRCFFGDPAFDFAEGWLDNAEFRRAYGTCPPAGHEDSVRMMLYRLLYGLMDGYVYACEYRMPEESRQCQQKVLHLLSQLKSL